LAFNNDADVTKTMCYKKNLEVKLLRKSTVPLSLCSYVPACG